MNASTPTLLAVVLAIVLPNALRAQEQVTLVREDGKSLVAIAYSPKAPDCHGIAIISHGAGGSERGYSFLGESMASLGYIAIVVGHQESGMPALRAHMRGVNVREALAALITDPKAYQTRFMDISASRQWAQKRCASSDAILLGHSMGAATVMMEAGARNLLGITGQDGFNAYIALSPQGSGIIFPTHAWAGIKRPVLSITGTRDDELGGGTWQTRTEPFMNLPAGCKWQAVIEGASHMQLAGIGMAREVRAQTVQLIAAFVEGYRRGDCTPPPPEKGLDLQSK